MRGADAALTEAALEPAPDGTTTVRDAPPWWLVIGAFAAIALLVCANDPSGFATRIPGTLGDGLLNLWILHTVQVHLLDGWDALWNAPIFHPASRTLAYSDSMLPVAIAAWPLRVVFGDTVASNIVYVGAWTASMWFTYRLTLRLVGTWEPAVVAALVFTLSTPRLAHHGHFQLVVGGALVPAVALALLALLERPAPWRAVVLAGALAALTTTSSYYGVMTSIAVAIVSVGWVMVERPLSRRLLAGLVTAAVVALVLVLPVAVQYTNLQRDPAFRRAADPSLAAHPSDFVAVDPGNRLLSGIAPFSAEAKPREHSVENRLFPGLVGITLAAVGAASLATGGTRIDLRRRRFIWLVVVAGGVSVLLAFGDHVEIAGNAVAMPFRYMRELPGLAGIRATSRLALCAQLAVALLAGVGVSRITSGRSRRIAAVVAVALCALVVAESNQRILHVTVPESGADSSQRVLDRLPPGPVAELPVAAAGHGWVWALTESPRQLLALSDGHPRVNGYSGFEPPGFERIAGALDGLPGTAGMNAVDRLGVRYLVVHTRPAGHPNATERRAIEASRVAPYSDAEALRLIARLPSERVADVIAADDGYVVVLRDPT